MPDTITNKPDVAKETAILREAVFVFAANGCRGADVQEIANRASVGKGTVYRYFGDKQALFWSAVYWVLEQLDAQMIEAIKSQPTAIGRLRAACLTYAKFFEQNPEFLEIFVLERSEFRGQAPERHLERHELMIERFSQIFQDGIDACEIRATDPRQAVWALGSTLYESVVFAAYNKTQRSLTEMATYATEILLNGFSLHHEDRESTP